MAEHNANTRTPIDARDEHLVELLQLWPDIASFLRELFLDLARADVLDVSIPVPTREELRAAILRSLDEAMSQSDQPGRSAGA